MKTVKNNFAKIVSFENLLSASEAARKGKNRKKSVACFFMDLEKQIWLLQEELTAKTYCPGKYRIFTIYDYDKKRQISAAPFRDRVVHHALHRIIEPVFDKTFIDDSYACRTGKGTHRAVRRFSEFARKNQYVLKCDVKKYFPSVDHQILKFIISRKIKDANTNWLIELIIDCSNEQVPVYDYFSGDTIFTPYERRRGIPIGNLTSQFFANVYLNGFDHYLKEKLGCKYYIRYVDDVAIFSDDKQWLWWVKDHISDHLSTLRLKLHEKKCCVYPVKNGVDFLGYRVFPGYRLLRRVNGYRFQRKLNRLIQSYYSTDDEKRYAVASVQAWLAHASHANTGGLKRALLSGTPFYELI